MNTRRIFLAALVLAAAFTGNALAADGNVLFQLKDGRVLIEDDGLRMILKADELETFEDAEIFVEQNVTDGDAEVVIEATGGDLGLRQFLVIDPKGRIAGRFTARGLGFREFLFESPEPDIEAVLKQFPEGDYLFVGTDSDGGQLAALAELSHDMPDAPVITAPAADATVPAGVDLVISWDAVDGADDYVVELKRELGDDEEGTEVELLFDVSSDVTMVTIPGDLLLPDSEYTIGVGVTSEDENVSAVEMSIFTGE
jgi:hypothetical protein